MNAESVRIGPNNDMITIEFVNQAGNGFVEELEVQKGATLGQFCRGRRENGQPTVNLDRCYVRVEGTEQPESYPLRDGDRVTATLRKIDGAL